MVGEIAKHMRYNSGELFSDFVGKYLGKPYSPNGHGPESYSCFGLVYAYCEDLGVKLPKECWTLRGCWNIANFSECHAMDERYSEDVMQEVIGYIGASVDPRQKAAGDIVVLKNRNTGMIYPAIYTGNGNVMLSFIGKGVRAFALNAAHEVISARRVR